MKKGMSQVLALIVAASVLMMTALTVIFLTQGSLQDVFGSSQAAKCNSALSFRVQNTPTEGTFTVPASCFSDEQPIANAKNSGCRPDDNIATKQGEGDWGC